MRYEQCDAAESVKPPIITRKSALRQVEHVFFIRRKKHLEWRALPNLGGHVAAGAEDDFDFLPGIGLECLRDLAQGCLKIGCGGNERNIVRAVRQHAPADRQYGCK